jgi:Zn-dependent protease/predicted transcriptional regulator
MFGKRITLFKLFGFEVRVDLSWLIIAFLIVWSLSRGFFPYQHKDLSSTTYLWMGIIGALGLFASIVFHELWHSLIARRVGLPMKGITLFVFGGVAEMDDEPPNAKAEFLMAIAGPFSSIVLGFAFYAFYSTFGKLPVPVEGVMRYLALINWILAGFNLLPAYPLDGGRVLRSALWSWRGDLRWATRIASQTGSAFGIVLILLGLINVFYGNVIGGIWWFVIGMFLRNASQMSYKQVLVRKALEGEKVRRFMNEEPVSVPPSISLRELVEDYVYKYHYKMFPVVENGNLVGCIGTDRVKEINKEEWDSHTVAETANQCSPDSVISPEADTLKALSVMSRTGKSRLMVVENNNLIGIIALKDILGFLSTKMDLENYGEG